ncbi:MAG: hypothetical protein ACK5RL_06565 [Acidimicrobiales bacterium]
MSRHPDPDRPDPERPDPERSGPRYATAWRPLDLSGVTERLATARDLLEQAAALTAAQEVQQLGAMVDQQQRRVGEERHGQPRRRRFR